jgi:hypothetical protein
MISAKVVEGGYLQVTAWLCNCDVKMKRMLRVMSFLQFLFKNEAVT